jgi:hypothetical protein
MPDLNAELAAVLKTLTEKVDQIDKRTSAIATAPNRYYVDAPEAAPSSAPPAARRKPRARAVRAKPIADQILDLVSEKPRSGPELSELIGSPRSSINQAVHALIEARRVLVLQEPPGRGSKTYVFPRGFKAPEEWLFRELGWERVSG